MPTDLTDAESRIADELEYALEGAGNNGLTASVAARRSRTRPCDARRVLAWMADSAYAHTTGNGSRARYHAGRSAR